MARKFELISEVYDRTAKMVTGNPASWQAFLRSACYNFRLRFDEQLLVFAQKPEATAVLEIERWNNSFGRWVNKGASGIAVFEDENRSRQRLKHYFDISDTHETRYSRPVPIWQMTPEYEADVIETLESTFGELDEKDTLAGAIFYAAENAVEDNIPDYLQDLIASKDGSLMEELDENTISVEYRSLVVRSVAYMVMERLGIDTADYFDNEDFREIYNFNTPDTLNALGFATSDIAEMALSEIAKTVISLERKNRTFAKPTQRQYNGDEIHPERSFDNERDLHDAGGLPSARPEAAGAAGGGAGSLRPDEAQVPEGAPPSPVLQPSDEGQADGAPSRDRAEGDGDGADPEPSDGGAAGRVGEPEGDGHDELGSEDEQHQELGTGDRPGGSDFRLSWHDRSTEDKSLPFLHGADTIHAILGKTPYLKQSKAVIRAFFETDHDHAERIDFVRSLFNNDYTELILDDGRRVGYKTYENVLHLWEGSYLSRTSEGYYDWGVIADHFDGMRMLGELQDNIKPLPSMEGQAEALQKAEEKSSAFTFTQEMIDRVLTRGSGFSEGKMRIYEQFQKSLSAKDNASFLKKEYGIGGVHPAVAGIDIDESYDGKGIRISKGIGSEKPHVTLSWSQVEKRIAELIRLDRYLSPKEAEQYPQWLTHEEERRREAAERRANREILSTTPEEKAAAEAPSHYEYHLGDTVYLGADEYEILSFDEAHVALYDVMYPLFNKELTRTDFDRMVAENPMNDHLKVYETLPAKEAITLHRVGDFYEMFGKEAEKAAEVLGLALTHRMMDNERVPMCGFPAHVREDYMKRLELAGYSINVEGEQNTQTVEQAAKATDDPLMEEAKKLIEEFIQEEYGEDTAAIFDDMTNVGVAYTTTEDDKHEIQVSVDLEHLKMNTFVDNTLVISVQYHDLQDLIDNGLTGMAFDDLISLTEEQLAPFYRDEEADDFSDIDPAAIREELAKRGIENGEVVDPEKLEHDPFIQQVTADVETLTKHEEPEKLTPAWQRKKKKANTFDLHPDVPMADRYTFDLASHPVDEVNKKERFHRNYAAITTLKKCQEEGRFATPEEQIILSKYVGWGGIPEAFDDGADAWHNEYAMLKAVLTPEEYSSARESTLTAFYTPPAVISAIYKAMEQMGFKAGNILEPSCGIGNFIGMLPPSMEESRVYGVELDKISAGIAQQLYQKTSIAAMPYERADIPDSFFDAVVGNVPFGDFSVADKRYDKNHFLIHDYFFAKSLDKLRPGGIMLLVTSKGTMDKESSAVRKYIAQRADLMGAIRLPNNTFKGNAGTEVVSDILILQKRDRIMDIEPDWVHLGADENGIRMNSYFIQHPEMVMGESKMVSGRFGEELTVVPYEGADLSALLSEAVSNIHGEVAEYEMDEELTEEDDSIPADPTVRNFSYAVVDDVIYYRENSRMAPVRVSATAENRIKGMIQIRDCVRTLLEMQTEDYPDETIKSQQAELNRLYDAFTKKYGLINSRGNTSAFSQDSSYSLLTALEVLDEEGNLERKADIFTRRTIKPHVPVTSVDTASEALAVSMGERAFVDMEYMCSLSGKSEEEIFNDLKGVIFLNPEGRPKYLMADEYLSGNVREKLRFARKSAEAFPELPYQDNIAALEKVQPRDLTASEIAVRLGATWLPTEVIQEFMEQLLDTPYYMRYRMQVHYSPYTSEWNIENKNYDRGNIKANTTYGTHRTNAYKIIEETLNLKDVRMTENFTPKKGGAETRPRLSPEEWGQMKQQERKATYDLVNQTALEIVADPAKFQSYLDTQSRMNRYSAANALLLYAQKPHATQIKSFGDWGQQNVRIKKGEKSIAILEPNEYTREDGTTGISYDVKKVFDVSQTNGKQNPSPTVNRDPASLVAIMLDTAPVNIEASDDMPHPNMGAYYDNDKQTLFVKKDIGDSVALFQCVAQELGHAQLAINSEAYNRSESGFNAVCVGYMLCKKFGVDTQNFTLSELPEKMRDGDAKTIREELTKARTAMSEIYGRVADELYRQKQERTKDYER